MNPRFLDVAHVLRIHERVVAEFGGDPSLRDHALLESAVSMPAATFDGAYLHESVDAMAAACLYHICRNHPFVDGNKRTALATAEVFLALHDRCLDASDDEVVELTLGVAEGRLTKDDALAFIAVHVCDTASPPPIREAWEVDDASP